MAPPSPSKVWKGKGKAPRGSGSSDGTNPNSSGLFDWPPRGRSRRPAAIRTEGSGWYSDDAFFNAYANPSRPSLPAQGYTNPDDEDENAINRGSAQIDATHTRLSETTYAQHRELADRLAMGEASAPTVQLTIHLQQSPPSSPAKLVESPKSARAKERKESLQKLQFDFLVNTDAKFSDAMKTITGIREWWYMAKSEWHEKRDELRKVDAAIATCKRQEDELMSEKGQVFQIQAQLAFNVPTTAKKLDRYRKQVESLEADRQVILKWLFDRRGLFKQVWNTFSLLKIGTPVARNAQWSFSPLDNSTPSANNNKWSSSGSSAVVSEPFQRPNNPVGVGLGIDLGPSAVSSESPYPKITRASEGLGSDIGAYRNKGPEELYAINGEGFWDAYKNDTSLFEGRDWVTAALQEMRNHRDTLKAEQTDVLEEQGYSRATSNSYKAEILQRSEESAQTTQVAEREMKALRSQKPDDEASRLLAVIQARHTTLRGEIDQRQRDQAEYYSSREREYDLKVQQLSVEARLRSVHVVIDLLKYILGAYDRKSRVEPDTLRHIYGITQKQFNRRGWEGEEEGAGWIRNVLQDFDAPRAKRTAIVQRLEQHYKWSVAPEDANEKLVRTIRHKGINSKEPETGRRRMHKIEKNFRLERSKFKDVIRDAIDIWNNESLLNMAPTFRNEIPTFSDHLPPVPTIEDLEVLIQPNPQNARLSWGPNTLTIADANALLSVKPSLTRDRRNNWVQEKYCWLDLLLQTITSPDIGQNFWDTSKSWHLPGFANLLNSFLLSPVSVKIIQAFLTYTTQVNELFHRGFFTKKISVVVSQGWESLQENQNRGLARKEITEPKSLSKPLKLVENLFLSRSDKFFIADRKIQKRDLFKTINSLLPTKSVLSISVLDSVLAHLQLRGKFFISDPFASSDSLIQIDNGWNISPLSIFPSTGGYRPKGASKIHNAIKNTDLTLLQGFPAALSEEEIYRAVCLGADGGCGWEVTRNRFHWYLRLQTERQEYFRLRRNGDVSVISRHWEKTFVHPAHRIDGPDPASSEYTLFPGAEGWI